MSQSVLSSVHVKETVIRKNSCEDRKQVSSRDTGLGVCLWARTCLPSAPSRLERQGLDRRVGEFSEQKEHV